MAKLKFSKTCPWRLPTGALAHFEAGSDYDVADDVAAEIIQAGYAEVVIEAAAPAPKKGKVAAVPDPVVEPAPVEGGE